MKDQSGMQFWLSRTLNALETGSLYAASLIDDVLKQAVDTIVRAEEAFREGLDPNIDDAKVIGEYEQDD
jgi:hypothetical protein